MKVYVYPADKAGCGYVRLIWGARYLQQQGYDVVITDPSAKTGIEGDVNELTGEILKIRIPADADVIVFQRILYRYIADAIPHIRRAGRAVVVDMDDDLTKIDPNNVAFAAMHPRNTIDKDRNWTHATRACLNASLVTVSTPALLDVYAPHGRGRVLENCIPAGFLAIPHSGSDAFGWSGAVISHPADAQVVGSSVSRLIRDGHEFVMVGPAAGARKAFGLEQEPDSTDYVPIEHWPFTLSQNLGVGIAPLADTKFNEAKSWLKPLEYASLGIACVATPSREYRRWAELSGITLAEKPNDWYRAVKSLVTSEAKREDQAGRAREAAAQYTIEDRYAMQLWEAWSDALRAERRNRTDVFSIPR